MPGIKEHFLLNKYYEIALPHNTQVLGVAYYMGRVAMFTVAPDRPTPKADDTLAVRRFVSLRQGASGLPEKFDFIGTVITDFGPVHVFEDLS